jgi:hypothetical protein
MTDGPINQNEQGSAVECCFRHAPAQYAVARGHAVPCARVRSVGTSSLSVPGGGDASEASGRSLRGFCSDYAQGSSRNSTSASSLRENQRNDDRRDCYTRIDCVSEHSEKAWLSRAQRSARFKLTLSICLIACTNRNSYRPTVFLCPFGNVPLAAM